MSNFFDNLIARSYNLKPVARPRLTSRFETTPGSLNQSTSPALEAEEFERTAEPLMNTSRVQPARESLAQQPFNNSRGAETEPPHSMSESVRVPVRSHRTEWQEPHDEPIVDAASSSLLNEGSVEASARSSTQNLSAFANQSSVEPQAHETRRAASGHSIADEKEATSINQATELEREAGLHEGGGKPSRDVSMVEETRGSVRAQASANLSTDSQRSDEGARRSVAPAKVATRSNVKESAAAPTFVESSSVETPDAAPVVRVSIGRIDVRAVMTDSKARPPAPPARQAPQTLSLEEYLKQRNGGGR